MFSIKIQGKEFKNFNDFKLNLTFDSIASTFSFNAQFNPENPDHRNLFRPASFRKCEVFDGNGELILTGVILNHKFSESSTPKLIGVSGYSVTGVLEDSSISPDSYPLESSEKSINQIATSLIKPFGLSLVSNEPEANEVLEKSTASATDTVKSYLSKICAQKNLILTHNATGKLLIVKQRVLNNSIPFLKDIDIDLTVNGQAMHSEITVLKQASATDSNSSQETIKNPFITDFQTEITPSNKFVPNYRPLVKEQSSGANGDTALAAKNALANDLKALKFSLKLKTWYINKVLIKPGTLVFIQSDNLFLYNKTKVFIQSVAFSGTPTAQVASLTCVLPEVYNNETPKNIFL